METVFPKVKMVTTLPAPYSKDTPVSRFRRNECAGFTLIEVLVAVLVLAIGLLGMAGLQTYSVGNTHSAYLRSQATFLSYDIIDRMRANPGQAQAGSYNTVFADAPPTSPPNCETSVCTPAQMASFDLSQWLLGLAGRLPGGDGQITTDVTGTIYTVAVSWDDRDVDAADGANATNPVTLQVSTEL
jgi:type IV pilus assembly protein PilV